MTLQKFWNQQVIKEFCRQPIYPRNLYDEIEKSEVIEVRSFLLAHYAHGAPHTNGGSINMALVDHLPELTASEVLFLGDLEKITDRILEDAKTYREQLKAINLASIRYALDQNI